MTVWIGKCTPWIQKHRDDRQYEKQDTDCNSNAKGTNPPKCVPREFAHQR